MSGDAAVSVGSAMNLLSLFSGIAGLDRAAHLFGIKTVAFVEFDPFCQAILKLRYPGVPVYGDIRQVTGKQLERDGITRIDIVAGGFPCQGNSTAGKRKGKADERYLWPEMARIIREVESQWVVAENVRGILSVDGGELFGDVIRDVAVMGHSVGWGCWGANAVGAPHKRERVFILGNSQLYGRAAATVQGSSTASVFNITQGAHSASQFAGASISGELSSSAGMMWPTPRANKIGGYSSLDFSPTLEQAVLWPTPKASLRGDCPSERNRNTPDLHSAVKLWGTHTASGSTRSTEFQRDSVTPAEFAQSIGGQLNPDWVECLMNFPIGWTDPECENPLQWPGWPAGRNQEQFDYEPSRVVTGIKHRAKRLKALGNAVVPLQAVPIFAAIKEIEAGA